MDVKKTKIENQSYCHSTELKNPDILIVTVMGIELQDENWKYS